MPQIEHTDDGIEVTITAAYDTIDGWEPSREDLGLNGGGPEPVDGIELVEQEPVYWEDGDEYPRGHSCVVLRFEDEDALEAASDRLYDKATERFEWGASDATDVQDFAGRLPTPFDVPEVA